MAVRAWSIVLACVVAGCSCGEPEALDSLSQEERETLAVLDHEGLAKLLAEHQGQPVVLAGWSANVERYAGFYRGLADLAKPGPEQGPAVIAMNLDGAAAVREKVLPLVREAGGRVANCVFDGEQMMLTAVVDSEWAGAVPALWVYDAKGQLEASFYGEGALAKAAAHLAQHDG